MVSKNLLKQLSQLGQKKYRQKFQIFPVEGEKSIITFLENGFKLKHGFTLNVNSISDCETSVISLVEMKKLSNLSTPSNAWAALKIPPQNEIKANKIKIALDGVRDPGNLGTIIRLCDWFGVNQIICSKDTVDCFNPKVIQASMGSLAKVEVFYKNLPIFFKNYHLTPIATDTHGKNIYKTEFQSNNVFVFGNEGNGISDDLKVLLNQYIKIPSFGKPAADSLNVAVAAGIILGEITRRG